MNILDLYGIFSIFEENVEKIKFSDLTNRYVKTLITKTKNKFNEIFEVLTEGGKINYVEDMLELLKFEEAGFKIKWIGYNRKQALKLKERRNA